ncbi:MAG: hypothetical protein ACSLEY_02560, partial [Candidatus Saccharimonadales bacterium]
MRRPSFKLQLLQATILCLPLFYVAIFEGFPLNSYINDISPLTGYSLFLIASLSFVVLVYDNRIDIPFRSTRARWITALVTTLISHLFILLILSNQPINSSDMLPLTFLFCCSLLQITRLLWKNRSRKNAYEGITHFYVAISFLVALLIAIFFENIHVLLNYTTLFILQSYAMLEYSIINKKKKWHESFPIFLFN